MSRKSLTLWTVLGILLLCLTAVPAMAKPPAQIRPIPITDTGNDAPVVIQDASIQLVGQLGGDTFAVAVEGDYAYIGMGSRLVILCI